MVPPVLIFGEPLRYTPEALAAHVQGLIIAKCTLTCQGEVKDCRIIKGLPHMNEAALAMLESRRYRPVYFQGRPISSSYAFPIRIKLPEDTRDSRPPRRPRRTPVIAAPKPPAPLRSLQ
jgi:protein TonB